MRPLNSTLPFAELSHSSLRAAKPFSTKSKPTTCNTTSEHIDTVWGVALTPNYDTVDCINLEYVSQESKVSCGGSVGEKTPFSKGNDSYYPQPQNFPENDHTSSSYTPNKVVSDGSSQNFPESTHAKLSNSYYKLVSDISKNNSPANTHIHPSYLSTQVDSYSSNLPVQNFPNSPYTNYSYVDVINLPYSPHAQVSHSILPYSNHGGQAYPVVGSIVPYTPKHDCCACGNCIAIAYSYEHC
jgi:hypothetical protein